MKIPLDLRDRGRGRLPRARGRRRSPSSPRCEGIVLATGGGAVLARGQPPAPVRERGTVIYLRARPRTCTSACATTATGRCSPPPIRSRGCASSTRARPALPRASPTSSSTPAPQSVQCSGARRSLDQLGGAMETLRVAARRAAPTRSTSAPGCSSAPELYRAATSRGGARRSSPTTSSRRSICARVQRGA